jgi:tRNA pseudouridine38-40 synthase
MQLKLTLEYDGGAFEGWQRQPDGRRTVQGELERALAIVLGVPTPVRGAGRTDAGVHATGQVATCPLIGAPPDVGRLRRSLNGVLARDVAVRDVMLVDDAFDPRRHARRRRYLYRIWNAPVRSPLWAGLSWHVREALDARAMDEAAGRLRGRLDLESFRGADPSRPMSTVREIFVSRVDRDGDLVLYTVEATAFLKHMVRNVIGTLVEVGRGMRAPDGMQALLDARDRRLAAPTAPARGLVLVAVEY